MTGRIATLAGDHGFGWVEAIAIRDGRVAFAGSEVYLETRADPFTERIRLGSRTAALLADIEEEPDRPIPAAAAVASGSPSPDD